MSEEKPGLTLAGDVARRASVEGAGERALVQGVRAVGLGGREEAAEGGRVVVVQTRRAARRVGRVGGAEAAVSLGTRVPVLLLQGSQRPPLLRRRRGMRSAQERRCVSAVAT